VRKNSPFIAQNCRLILSSALAALCLYTPSLHAQDALFIGNSYTYGGPEKVIHDHGGVPKLVEAIASSKGKSISTLMLTVGGKDLGYHLQQPVTEQDLNLKTWDWVVLQDFSSEATHVGKLDAFFQNGESFTRKIMEHSPKTRVVLYETWARPKQSPFYSGTSTPKTFLDVAQMNSEIQKNYGELFHRLDAIDPAHVELAPVGLAFERCVEKYPGLNLYCPDLHHANTEGSYLAALVIYSTIFQDTPKGATHDFFGTSLDAEVATKLQEIADSVTSQKVQ